MNEYQLKDENFWYNMHDDVGVIGGAYRLFCKRNNRRIPISRFLGKDTDGLIYIGKADCFVSRIIALKKTIDPEYKSNPHSGGRRYKLNPNVPINFPYEDLYVELFQSQEPKIKEDELLDEYFQKFGEVPPLNAI